MDNSPAQTQMVGLDPTVVDGYDNVTAVYQNTSLITGPSDVQNEKDFLLPYVQQTGAAVASCGQDVPASLKAWWATWITNWNKFYGTKSTIFSASDDLAKVKKMRTDLAGFQQQLASYCPDAGPLGVPAPDPTILGALAAAERDLLRRADDAAKAFNTTARVAIVVGGVLVAWFIYQQVKVAKTLGPIALKNLPLLGAL